MYPGSSLYVLTIPVVALIVWRCASQRASFARFLTWVAFAVYVTELLSLTFFPLPVDSQFIAIEQAAQYGSHNWVPLSTISAALSHSQLSVALMQIGGNILLFIPLGYFLPLLFGRFRRFSHAACALLAATLTVELAQLLLSSVVFHYVYKSFDVDDIFLNLAGGLIGYGVFKLLEPGVRGSRLDDPEPCQTGDSPPA